VKFPYIPYAYFLSTRLKGGVQRISWGFVYFVPIFIFYGFYDAQLLQLLLMYYAVNLVYENGYIQNDVFTIKKESKPSLRLTDRERDYIEANALRIFIFRAAILSLILAVLYHFSSEDEFYFFLLLLVFLQCIYFFYNSLRGRINLFLIAPLSYFRFYLPLIPILVFSGNNFVIGSLFFIYPFTKFLEFFKQPRYRMKTISCMVSGVDKFRVVYYFILSIFFGTLLLCWRSSNFLFLFCLSFYYFCFRLAGFFLYSWSGKFKEIVINGAKKYYRK